MCNVKNASSLQAYVMSVPSDTLKYPGMYATGCVQDIPLRSLALFKDLLRTPDHGHLAVRPVAHKGQQQRDVLRGSCEYGFARVLRMPSSMSETEVLWHMFLITPLQ